MRNSDAKMIELLWKSPARSFSTVLDTLEYLDSQWVHEDREYELFSDAIESDQNVIRTKKVLASEYLHQIAQLAIKLGFIKRRVKKVRTPKELCDRFGGEEEEYIALYWLTKTGKQLVKNLRAIDRAQNIKRAK